MIAAPTVEAIEVIVVDQSEPFLERDFLGKDTLFYPMSTISLLRGRIITPQIVTKGSNHSELLAIDPGLVGGGYKDR
jgi:hypothetical protein